MDICSRQKRIAREKVFKRIQTIVRAWGSTASKVLLVIIGKQLTL